MTEPRPRARKMIHSSIGKQKQRRRRGCGVRFGFGVRFEKLASREVSSHPVMAGRPGALELTRGRQECTCLFTSIRRIGHPSLHGPF